MLQPGKYEVLVYQDRAGNQPYALWLDTLDWKTQERILARVARLGHGQFGDYKPVGDGLYELRLFFGPGYRVYFGEHKGKRIIVLAVTNRVSHGTSNPRRHIGRFTWRITNEKDTEKYSYAA